MIKRTLISMFASLAMALTACASGEAKASNANSDQPSDNNPQTMDNTTTPAPAAEAATGTRVRVSTTMGDFTVLLYDDTPLHRDNFLKLVREGYYDGVLFHRVINEFMVQTGDPDSRQARPGQALGSGGPGYTIEAEIVYPRHFHRRGALAAARQGDQVNPTKRSSGSQFYIVTGSKLSEGQMSQLDAMATNKQKQRIFNELANAHMDEIRRMQQAGDQQGLRTLQQELIDQTEARVAAEGAQGVTDEMRQAYTTVGGAPHLDGDYTVFGEVIDGMDVIDRIEKVQTDGRDRPTEDVRITSMKVLD